LQGFSKTSVIGRRDRAMALLMYRAGLKIGQVVSLERKHYAADRDTSSRPVNRGQTMRACP
jgi:site-specific recombinase XerC